MKFDETYIHGVMSGKDRSLKARLLRTGAAIVEPFYAMAMTRRNRGFATDTKSSVKLARPTISVGNITTGGTGKTPTVRWLANQFVRRGHRPAILMRGYGADENGFSDEQAELQQSLQNVEGGAICVVANPDRVAGAATALQQDASAAVFILDDGMQHRRVQRQFELVLINAAEPFGFGRVFPRGMLREPLTGLSRASAFLLTHASETEAAWIELIERRLRQFSSAPVFRSDHQITRFVDSAGAVMNPSGRKAFAFCGIGSPQSFFAPLALRQEFLVGKRAMADHHVYQLADLQQLQSEAKKAGAEVLVTTEKDWVKVSRVMNGASQQTGTQLPIWRAQLELTFARLHEQQLLHQILGKLFPRQ